MYLLYFIAMNEDSIDMFFNGEASPIFSHAMQIFLRAKTVKTMNF